jgi:hypothetical protein
MKICNIGTIWTVSMWSNPLTNSFIFPEYEHYIVWISFNLFPRARLFKLRTPRHILLILNLNHHYMCWTGFLRRVRNIEKSVYYLRHVCSYVCMEQNSSHWTDFHEICYLNIFGKSVEKDQDSRKYDKNNGYITRIEIYIYIYDENAFYIQ